MFSASRPFLFFDYFRVPYELTGEPAGRPRRPCGEVRWTAGGSPARSLYWLPADDRSTGSESASRLGDVRPIPIYGRVMPDEQARPWLAEIGGHWTRVTPITDPAGRRFASLWRSAQGDIFLPFDPGAVIESYWSEAYQRAAAGRAAQLVKATARRAYYRVRPVLPRRSQIGLRRAFSRLQARAAFPRWPVEPALHQLYDLLFRCAVDIAREPVPSISPWPNGRSWALVLSHDVETEAGYEHLHVLRDVEAARGYRSSWNFVPLRYAVADAVVRELSASGFEVGVHGLYHDGRDLESLATLTERLPAIRDYARRWDAVGFRAPATHRNWEWMPLLRFEYDSSYPDTDPYEPQAGGCCTWLPFFNEDLVELPITLPQDHTLFTILRKRDESLWRAKTMLLRRQGGMALLLTHPDYMVDPALVACYRRFLDEFAEDTSAWHALPREVARWWRRRAASRLVNAHGSWTIEGPAAADGDVTFHHGAQCCSRPASSAAAPEVVVGSGR